MLNSHSHYTTQSEKAPFGGTRQLITGTGRNKQDYAEVTKIGGISRGNRIQRNAARRENIEAQFMAISFKANRADDQRNDRRAKR